MVKRNKNGYLAFRCPKCSDHHTISGRWSFREHLRRVHGLSKAAALAIRSKMMGKTDESPSPRMRKLKIRSPKTALLTLTRSHHSTAKMVYILAANKHLPYKDRDSKTVGRSRILYIGTTKKGWGRPAASALNKATEVFYHLPGVRTIDVHVVTCATHKKQGWKRLEAALLDAFRKRYFQLPKYNKVRPKPVEGLFGSNTLQKLIARFEPK
jgi:hypothetical protein